MSETATLNPVKAEKSELELQKEAMAEAARERRQWLIDHPERHAELGMVVYWYLWADRANGGIPAIVTAVNEDGTRLTLSVHEPGGVVNVIKPFVAHVDEENIPFDVKKDSGGWEHAPWMLRLLKLLAVMDKKLAK